LYGGRVLSNSVRVAIGIQAQRLFGSTTHNDLLGNTTATTRSGTVELLTFAGWVYVRTSAFEMVPLLSLLGVIRNAYLAAGVGYTRAGDVKDVDAVQVEQNNDGVFVGGGMRWIRTYGQRWAMGPEIGVEYHQFPNWYVLTVVGRAFVTFRL